ncbi:MAG TPA: hypothetical protein VNH39_01180 [Steroidobacteraceae bacterium]|nr:hypothetical protein [Steroidobacteraceae bacterium]
MAEVGLAVPRKAKVLVPACHQCNCIAGKHTFRSIGAKRRYIQRRLAQKFKRLLAMPDWSESELDELGYALRQSIINSLGARDYLRGRLAWRNHHNSDPAKLANVRLRFVDIGRASARQSAPGAPIESD